LMRHPRLLSGRSAVLVSKPHFADMADRIKANFSIAGKGLTALGGTGCEKKGTGAFCDV
jgi:hypothetical protein